MLPPQRFAAAARPTADPDNAIRQTDDDAASSRLSAASLGYLSDPYLPLLHKSPYPSAGAGAGAGPSRKPPLINVGTHHRTYALDVLVDRFLRACARAGRRGQVLSLGAGSDTRFWRLASREEPLALRHYVEVDFALATSTKAQRIARSPKLYSLLGPHSSGGGDACAPSSQSSRSGNAASRTGRPYAVTHAGTGLSSPLYSLIPLDLRRDDAIIALDALCAPPQTASTPASTSLSSDAVYESETAHIPRLDTSAPTLILAECVLCYMTPDKGNAVLRWAAERFADCSAVVYEMVGLNDTFGQVMRRNLAARSLSIPGAVYVSPTAMAERFSAATLGPDAAFETYGAETLWGVRSGTIPPHELQRIAQLEHLDEIEELRLVLSHYCIAWATKGAALHSVKL